MLDRNANMTSSFPFPVMTALLDPSFDLTILPSMPVNVKGNCSISASKAATVSRACRAYSSSSSMLASRWRFDAEMLLDEGSAESMPFFRRRSRSGG